MVSESSNTQHAANPAASFVHVSTYRGRPYAYDVNTNTIFEIDRVLADVLPLFGPLDRDAVCDRLAGTHERRLVELAVTEIEQARAQENLFLSERPQIAASCAGRCNWERYETGLNQLTLTLTEQCNLRCRYCYHHSSHDWIRPFRNRHMSRSTALKALAYFAERCAYAEMPTVSFYGGEPLLRFDVIKAVVEQASVQTAWPELTFIIDTNGTLLDDEIIEFVADHEIHLQVSLDGPPALHDRHRVGRNGETTHATIEHGLERLLRRDPGAATRLSFVVTLAPPYDFLAAADYFADLPLFRDLGITTRPSVTANIANLDGVEIDGQSGHDLALLREHRDRARERYVQACLAGQRSTLSPLLTNFFENGLIRFHHRSRKPLPERVSPTGCCQPGQRRLHVRTDGVFQPCERVGEVMAIGDVDRGFDRAVIERLYAEMFAAVRQRCRDCWAVRQCGLCFTVLAPTWSDDASRPSSVPETACEEVRNDLDGLFRFYLALLEQGPDAVDFLQDTSVI